MSGTSVVWIKNPASPLDAESDIEKAVQAWGGVVKKGNSNELPSVDYE
jgi:hypothetical protein